MLAVEGGSSPNVSRMAEIIGTSRATVMNYLKYLEEARLINMVYREGETFPKKPAGIMLHDTNLLYAVYNPQMSEQLIMETFFVNTLWRHHTINKERREGFYKINHTTEVCVCELPLWLFGFLY